MLIFHKVHNKHYRLIKRKT